MREFLTDRRWTRYVIYRAERTKTTWKFRFAVLVFIGVAVWFTRPWWTVAVAQSLVCNAPSAASDALVVENFDSNYLTFERAARLRRDGIASRVLVPVPADPNTHEANAVGAHLSNTLLELARLDGAILIPVREVEPIELNTARSVLRFVNAEHIRSIVVVSPLFRSRRAALVYQATLGAAGIAVTCEPVAEVRTVNTWTHSWHGIQDVMEQWVKLQYYRIYVLPFRSQSEQATD